MFIIGKPLFKTLARQFSATASKSDSFPKLVLRNAGGKRLTSSEFHKIVESAEYLTEKVLFPKEALEIFSKEYDNLLEENSEFCDKYTRSLAETENVRKRFQRQLEDTKMFAVQGFCKDLLEVADILNLALNSLEKNNEKGSTFEENLKDIREGVEMTKNVLLKTFNKHGLEPIFPIGQKFDPNLHDAIFEIPQDQSKYEPGHVHNVLKIGYRLHDRPIRPAKVGVVKS